MNFVPMFVIGFVLASSSALAKPFTVHCEASTASLSVTVDEIAKTLDITATRGLRLTHTSLAKLSGTKDSSLLVSRFTSVDGKDYLSILASVNDVVLVPSHDECIVLRNGSCQTETIPEHEEKRVAVWLDFQFQKTSVANVYTATMFDFIRAPLSNSVLPVGSLCVQY